MKIQILGLIFVGLLPFLVTGATKAKDEHILRFGRSVMDQNDMFMRALRIPGNSDMFMRALRSPGGADMLMRALRSSDMFMRSLRSNEGYAKKSTSDMFMRALRDPWLSYYQPTENEGH